MKNVIQCPECGADCSDGQNCIDHFHLMGIWELDYQLFDVHHLMVLCYYLQHPNLYSPEALSGAMKMLVEFLEEGITPQMMRKSMSKAVDSLNRQYKIKGTAESYGEYKNPIVWQMRAKDVIQLGVDNYYSSVRSWATVTLESLRKSGNLS